MNEDDNKKKLEIVNALVYAVDKFDKCQKQVRTKIRKGELTDEWLVEYYTAVFVVKEILVRKKEEILTLVESDKTRRKQFTRDKLELLHKDMLVQQEWINKQFSLRNDIREKSQAEIVNYQKLIKEKAKQIQDEEKKKLEEKNK